MTFILLNLYVCCLYVGIFSRGSQHYGQPNEHDSWLPPPRLKNADTSVQFVYALYFAFYLMTGKGRDPDIPATEGRLIFGIFVFFMGSLLSAYIIGET